jgi:hypothetical protein
MKASTIGLTVSFLASMSLVRVARADCNSNAACISQTNTGIGLAFYGHSPNGAILGQATTGIGVQGYSESTTGGVGVYGTTNGTGTGVYGQSSGIAIHGQTTGTTSSAFGIKGQAASSVSTGVWGYNPTGTAGRFDGNVTYTGSLTHVSDGKLKKDVRDLSYGLEQMLKLRPVSFSWKREDGGKTHLGFIAQEVQKVVPEVVLPVHEPEGADVLTVDYVELVPVLMKAVQEQNKIITQQGARIAALEGGHGATRLSSLLGGGAALGLLPLGLVLARRRRRARGSSQSV